MANTDPTVIGTTDPTLTTDVTSSSSSSTPVVLTAPQLAVAVDQADADYSPGETVGITATNVAVGGSVQFSVAHVGAGVDGVIGTADDVLTHDLTGTVAPWTVTDGGVGDLDGLVNGAIQTAWYVNADAANQAFVLSATDAASGATAMTTFTDSVPADADVNLTTANSTGTVNGAIFVTPSFGAGTGVIDPFVRVGANTHEQGYNSGDVGKLSPNPQFDETGKYGSQYNHALQLSDIPTISIFNPATQSFDVY